MSSALRTDFTEPPALDLLAEFRRQFGPLVERRTAELRAMIKASRDDGLPAEMRAVYDEYEALTLCERWLNRVIAAFVNEATKPWRDAYAESLMRVLPPALTLTSFDETILGKPTGKCEKCGGLLFGSASHYCPSGKASGTHAAAGNDEFPADPS